MKETLVMDPQGRAKVWVLFRRTRGEYYDAEFSAMYVFANVTIANSYLKSLSELLSELRRLDSDTDYLSGVDYILQQAELYTGGAMGLLPPFPKQPTK